MEAGIRSKAARMSEELRPIIEAAKGGDREALNLLGGCADRFLRIFSGKLSRRVRRTCGSTVDFVLEGLAGALARLPAHEYLSDEAFYAWIGRHIHHLIVDAHRAEGRKKRGREPLPLESPEGGGSRGPEAAGPSPSEAASAAERLEKLGEVILAVQAEHPREMEAVVLKVFEGCSFPEIQARLSLNSERCARLLFLRGLDLLRPRVRRLSGSDDRPGRFDAGGERGRRP